MALILPDGQISHFLSSPACKNIPLLRRPKSLLYPPPSRPTEGRIAIVTDAGRDAVDAAASGTQRESQGEMNLVSGRMACGRLMLFADGKGVWVWHPLVVVN